ncbi:hypothetical protein AHAS_Ahas01G0093200 [Arachis hypogaea]
MDVNKGEAIGECGGGLHNMNEEMNRAEAGGDEVQEEQFPKGGQGFDLSADDILNQVWESVEDAYEFYRRYRRVNEFREGLRNTRHYDRIDRKWGHKPNTQTGCKAMLSIYLKKSEQK